MSLFNQLRTVHNAVQTTKMLANCVDEFPKTDVIANIHLKILDLGSAGL